MNTGRQYFVNNTILIKKYHYSPFSKYTKSVISRELPYYPNDVIGPPDPVSNLRPIKFFKHPSETPLEKKYRVLRENTQIWNQEFWNNHNQRFLKDRQSFISKNTNEERTSLNADEMSVFYKTFLDNNWTLHTNYNIEWYKKNIQIFLLALQVAFQRATRKQIL